VFWSYVSMLLIFRLFKRFKIITPVEDTAD
jgi:hypothetical protein